ncbi:MAG TPA: ABC transporter ATP-binding protein [bacterium]|jgi:ABC-type lipoprotein export system ATPase subunit|nr:MAG: Lipoprotein-releasing system ATP-binding protein LolD [Parcubacteria group bacterium ADurb.Bin115]HNU81551.1 ABC transporter ATP-binding protein [bacterium]HPY99329.1 ABC transporter ATP-binding protein [bacterium]HQB76304.1 ABC transporter ATP-binding protein [bacterium]
MAKVLLDIKNLSKTYVSGDLVTEVLKDISFQVNTGEFVSIMGPSGSGKSTLMHILGLLERSSSGIYNFAGKNIGDLNDEELAHLRNQKIGFVFQAFNLLARTSVLDNVKLPLIYSTNKKNMDERARKVLKSVGLDHRLSYFSNQISGGEKQRVAIARALVNDPALIFADEPTGNLDSKSGVQVIQILQELNARGKTIILVTHETFTAEHAQRIIQVHDGRIVSDKAVKNRRFAKDGELLK